MSQGIIIHKDSNEFRMACQGSTELIEDYLSSLILLGTEAHYGLFRLIVVHLRQIRAIIGSSELI